MGTVQHECDRANKEANDQQRLGRLLALLDVATIMDENVGPKGNPWGHVQAVKKLYEFLKSEKARLGHE